MGESRELVNGADLDGVEVRGLRQERVELRDGSVVTCRFVQVQSPEVDLRGAAVRQTEFLRPDFTIAQAWRGRWNDVRVEGGRFGVLEAYDAVWNAVEFVNCKFAFVNLRGSEMSDIVFKDCRIEELNVSDSNIRRASLGGSHVDKFDLRGATMEHVDLRGSTYDHISGVANMGGTIVSEAQLAELAPLLAASVGISVS